MGQSLLLAASLNMQYLNNIIVFEDIYRDSKLDLLVGQVLFSPSDITVHCQLKKKNLIFTRTSKEITLSSKSKAC